MIRLSKDLLRIGAVELRGPDDLFTWASGIQAPIYCDNRLTLSFPEIRDRIAHAFALKIEELGKVDVIVGTATAGIAHAAWVAQKLGLPMAYVRSKSKDHGKSSQIEGIVKKGDRVVIIEDLISTGGSAQLVVDALKEQGAEVVALLAIFSYNFQEATKRFDEDALLVETLTDYRELLSIVSEESDFKPEELELLEKWSENPRMFTP